VLNTQQTAPRLLVFGCQYEKNQYKKKSSAEFAKLYQSNFRISKQEAQKKNLTQTRGLVFLLSFFRAGLALLFLEEFFQAVNQALFAADHMQTALCLMLLQDSM
jgi:hypothetical protein